MKVGGSEAEFTEEKQTAHRSYRPLDLVLQMYVVHYTTLCTIKKVKQKANKSFNRLLRNLAWVDRYDRVEWQYTTEDKENA